MSFNAPWGDGGGYRIEDSPDGLKRSFLEIKEVIKEHSTAESFLTASQTFP